MRLSGREVMGCINMEGWYFLLKPGKDAEPAKCWVDGKSKEYALCGGIEIQNF